jgi:hypothetical protein
LTGYFQSYRYFDEHFQTISRFIKLDDKKNELKKKFSFDYENMISMHFRLGDYKYVQHYHPILKPDYYRNVLKEISCDEKSIVLYFCEAYDNIKVGEIVKKLSSEFPDIRFLKAHDALDDWEQMLLMSLCKTNIIANSTFSWWSAYFNSHPDKRVYYPSNWFGPSLAMHDTRDLCPKDWICVRA